MRKITRHLRKHYKVCYSTIYRVHSVTQQFTEYIMIEVSKFIMMQVIEYIKEHMIATSVL